MESVHPFLEPAIVSVDVLDMVNTRDHAYSLRQVHRSMDDAHFARDRAQCLAAIGTQNGVGCQDRLQDSADMFLVRAFQHEVRHAARAIPANQHRNLFVRQAAFAGLAASLAGRARKPAFLAFERFEELLLEW